VDRSELTYTIIIRCASLTRGLGRLKAVVGGEWSGSSRANAAVVAIRVVVRSREPAERSDGRCSPGRARQTGRDGTGRDGTGRDMTDGSATCLCSVVVRGVDALIGQRARAQQTHPPDPSGGQLHLMSSARRGDCRRCDVRVVGGISYGHERFDINIQYYIHLVYVYVIMQRKLWRPVGDLAVRATMGGQLVYLQPRCPDVI